mmetsp:Transcript_2058/g.6662  ORF Transcript_2058/g.6662 Transcript_2058/m.6662 type:complete len:239 (-) Transcript_2058:2783-3499(-)
MLSTAPDTDRSPLSSSNNRTAASCCLLATIRVLSKWSGHPGPRPIHCCTRPSHVLCTASHGRPVSMQNAPSVLGDVSPTLAWQNAATKPLPMSSSMNSAAAPLLSPLISLFVLFIEVPWTANHENAPMPRPSSSSTRSSVSSLSTSSSYMSRSHCGFFAYAVGLRFTLAPSTLVFPARSRPGASPSCARTIDRTIPSTSASKVSLTNPSPVMSYMRYWRYPAGPECVWVPESTTLSAE